MDAFTLRLSELETLTEDLEKENGKLQALVQKNTEALQLSLQILEELQEKQTAMLEDQKKMRQMLRAIDHKMHALTKRADALDETADILEDRTGSMKITVDTLSRDMDTLYEDMNILSEETRTRGAQMKAEMQRFFWDATEHKYDEGTDTMW